MHTHLLEFPPLISQMRNRAEWESKGKSIVAEYVQEFAVGKHNKLLGTTNIQ